MLPNTTPKSASPRASSPIPALLGGSGDLASRLASAKVKVTTWVVEELLTYLLSPPDPPSSPGLYDSTRHLEPEIPKLWPFSIRWCSMEGAKDGLSQD